MEYKINKKMDKYEVELMEMVFYYEYLKEIEEGCKDPFYILTDEEELLTIKELINQNLGK